MVELYMVEARLRSECCETLPPQLNDAVARRDVWRALPELSCDGRWGEEQVGFRVLEQMEKISPTCEYIMLFWLRMGVRSAADARNHARTYFMSQCCLNYVCTYVFTVQ